MVVLQTAVTENVRSTCLSVCTWKEDTVSSLKQAMAGSVQQLCSSHIHISSLH